MTNILDFLGTVAEFSIGLAGFAGIVAALARYHRTEIAVVRFRMMNLLVSSFAPGFFALLTFALVSAALEPGVAIRTSSGLLAVYLILWAVLVHRSRPPGVSRPVLVMMSSATVLNTAAQLASLFGLVAYPGAAYLGGLILLLLQGAAVFVILVMDALQARRDVAAAD